MSALQRLGITEIKSSGVKNKLTLAQQQTKDAFGYKWSKRNTYESDVVKANAKRWLFDRYCENDSEKLTQWLGKERKIILDVGCGSGFSALLFFGDHLKNHDYLGIDISQAVEVAKTRFFESGYLGDFIQADFFNTPVPDASIDLIFSEGVLHHTDNTQNAIHFLAKKLKPDGKFLFYVYRKKAAIREFTDDYIRNQIQDMSDEGAWQALESLTKLGIELGKLNIEIDVPDDIPYLGISKGKIDIQRFFYWNICKLYYRPEYSLEEMNHVNFDWFRPLNCHRHSPEEIKLWCDEASLQIEHINVQEAGITVVATKL